MVDSALVPSVGFVNMLRVICIQFTSSDGHIQS